MRRALEPLLVLLLCVAFLLQALLTLPTTAPVFDEIAHLPAGYASLTRNAQHLNPEHPPLAKLLAALPLLPVAGPVEAVGDDWQTLSEWEFGRRFLFGVGRNPDQLMMLGRLPMVGLGLMLLLVGWAWSRRLFGVAGGLTTLGLAAGCPTFLAHARLVTTDVPVAAFGLLSAWLAWRQTQRSSWIGALGLGLALGATLATKFSGVLFPMALCLAVVPLCWRRANEVSGRRLLVGVGWFSLVAGAALAVVMASYGSPRGLHAYLEGVRQVGFNHTPGYAFYLLGAFDPAGFPHYFPLAFLLKSSPALLLGLLLLLCLPLLRQVRLLPAHPPLPLEGLLILGLPALMYASFVAARAPDIGVRYLLPAYPFLFVGLGALGQALVSRPSSRLVLAVLAFLHGQAAAKAWPDPLSYFNGFLGCSGPQAIRCLDDSNLDWGQDLGRVGKALAPLRQPGEEVAVLYFGTAELRHYIPDSRRMREDELLFPSAQLYAVSLHRLNRLVWKLGNIHQVDWLHAIKPVAVVGNTWYIYDFRQKGARLEGSAPKASLASQRVQPPMTALAPQDSP